MQRNRTVHRIRSPKIRERLRLAVASDLHSAPFDDVLEDFAACDAVLIPGDLVDRHRRDNRNAYRFLQAVPEIVPVFYSIGNHERKFRQAEQYVAAVRESAVNVLRREGVKAGLIRPLTVYPFPVGSYDRIDYGRVKGILDVEMSIPALFLEDVETAVAGRAPISTCLCSGGNIMSRDAVLRAAAKIMEGN